MGAHPPQEPTMSPSQPEQPGQPNPHQPAPQRRSRLATAAKIVVFGTLGAIAMAAPMVASAAIAVDERERGPHHACWEDLLDAAETDEEEHEAFEAALSDCGIHLFGRTWRITAD